MQAYLDNSATTVCEPGVVEKVVQMMSVIYGNPSAMHNYSRTDYCINSC